MNKFLRKLRGGVFFKVKGVWYVAITDLYKDRECTQWAGLNNWDQKDIDCIEDYRGMSILQRIGVKP